MVCDTIVAYTLYRGATVKWLILNSRLELKHIGL